MGMIFLDSCGSVIDDPDEWQEAIRPFLEVDRRDQRSGPCEDDCQLTAIGIEDAVRYEADYLDPRSHVHIDRILAYYMQQGLYPEKLHEGPQGLPCGGILSNNDPYGIGGIDVMSAAYLKKWDR